MPNILEDLFEGKKLNEKAAISLVHSFGTHSELRSLTAPFSTSLEFPAGDRWYVELPRSRDGLVYLGDSFVDFCDFSWDVFIRTADFKKFDLHNMKKEIQEKNPDGFRLEMPKAEIEVLQPDIDYVISKIKEEQMPTYHDPCCSVPFFTRALNLSEVAKATEDTAKVNFFWAFLGSYLSQTFDKYMQAKRKDGSTSCSEYNRDLIFRHFVMQPLLKGLFNKIKGNLSRVAGDPSFIFNNIDLAVVERRLSGLNKEEIIDKLLLYPNVLKPEQGEKLSWMEYRIIRKQLLQYGNKLQFMNGSLESVLKNEPEVKEILDKSRDKARMPELLALNESVIDSARATPYILNELRRQGIEDTDRSFLKFKQFAKILKEHDWLVNVIYPRILEVSTTEFKGKEEELEKLYQQKRLADFTGKRPMFKSGLVGLIWGLDLVNSEKFRGYFKNIGMTEKEAEKSVHDIHYQFIMDNPNEKIDNSLLWKIASKIESVKMPHLKGGDCNAIFLEGGKEDNWVALEWIFAIKEYYDEQVARQDPSLKEKSGYDINYRSGAAFGFIQDKYANSEVIGIAKYLYTSGKEEKEHAIQYRTSSNEVKKMMNEVIMFASGKSKEGAVVYNLFDKLNKELSTIQEYISTNNTEALKKLPVKIREALEAKQKDIEAKKASNALGADAKLDITMREHLYTGENEKDGQHEAKFKSYTTDLFKVPILYIGEYAGSRPWKFDIYALLPTTVHFEKFIKNCMEAPK